MTQPFLGEIKMFAGNFAPRTYAVCNGQILSIQQNTALFSLLGTTYGGNGTTNFALPNLQGRVPVHQGTGTGLSEHVMGEQGGVEDVTLNASTMAAHTHTLKGRPVSGTTTTPGANTALAKPTPATNLAYKTSASNLVLMSPASVTLAGNGLPHNNIQPYLALTFIIALTGIFPARN